MNGSGDEPIDESPNVTEFPCAVTFRAISLETSMGINFFYANGKGYLENRCAGHWFK